MAVLTLKKASRRMKVISLHGVGSVHVFPGRGGHGSTPASEPKTLEAWTAQLLLTESPAERISRGSEMTSMGSEMISRAPGPSRLRACETNIPPALSLRVSLLIRFCRSFRFGVQSQGSVSKTASGRLRRSTAWAQLLRAAPPGAA